MNNKVFPYDESLQSYIFRHEMLNGGTNFSSLISRNGEWLTHVKLDNSQKSYFVNHEEKLLLSLIKSNYERVVKLDFFHNPFFYLELFKCIFKEHENSNWMLQFSNFKGCYKRVSFCNLCVKDSLFSYGFGYFKEDWTNGGGCKVHNVPIYYLPVASVRKTISSIREVLLGGIPSVAVQYSVTDVSREKSFQSGIFQKPISPCLFRLIHRKLCRIIKHYCFNRGLYEEHLERGMYSAYKKLFDASGAYIKADAIVIEDIINKLLKLKYSPIMEVLDSLYEELEVFNGVEQSFSCSELMLVPKVRACLTCTHSNKYCGLSHNIAMFTSVHKYKKNIKNYCDIAQKNSTAWYLEEANLLSSGEYSVVDNFWNLKESSYYYDLHSL
ncbi:hypothetical protein TUM4438_36480 [Shewanella sairae]|uniref:Uncharacterized protein n=1 Tax=Shewanella sairae TaxID=190310 RepID=A0ABQ4PP63_9GAMM|nr:hypothetical protein [Shewanella sairae]MCL1132106.1 hypothetical protein [Shewanella sairae]GIU50447.1 hypothetical protein TUM4438_36480 [Shewanella sairae]